MTKVRILASCALCLGLLLSGCSKSSDHVSAAVKSGKDRKAAPAFSVKDANGQTVSLDDYKGKVVLLNFWATWCGPCKIEIPWFIEFEQKYKDRGFAVLGISMDEEGWEAVKPYIEKSKINYRVAVGNDGMAQMYGGVDSLPTTFVIDAAGRIASTHIGLVSKSDYENEIKHLLDNDKAASGAVSVAAARGAI